MGSGTHPPLPYGTFAPSYLPYPTLPYPTLYAFAAHLSLSSPSAVWLCATCCSPAHPYPLLKQELQAVVCLYE